MNDKAADLIQDAGSYQKLFAKIDRAGVIEGIRRGLDSVARSEVRSVEDVRVEFVARCSIAPDG